MASINPSPIWATARWSASKMTTEKSFLRSSSLTTSAIIGPSIAHRPTRVCRSVMVADGVADVFAGLGLLVVVRHEAGGLELVTRPLGEALEAIRGVLGVGAAGEGDVRTPLGTEARGAAAQRPAGGEVVGADEGDAGVAVLAAVHVRVQRDDLDALLLEGPSSPRRPWRCRRRWRRSRWRQRPHGWRRGRARRSGPPACRCRVGFPP